MTMLGLIEHMWGKNTCKQKISFEWIGHPTHPTDHMWDALGCRISARQIPPRTLQELKSALLEEWSAVPQDSINPLVSL
ncbi:hypothetical protein X975_23884, partial [Stegodyphus mimosarum]